MRFFFLRVHERGMLPFPLSWQEGRPTRHPARSPPTLLAERNRRRYYYRPDRKLAEPQRRSEQTSLSAVYSCDSDSRPPCACAAALWPPRFLFPLRQFRERRGRAAPAVPCRPSGRARVPCVALIIGWRCRPRPLLSRRARCLFVL